ncbi:MAG: hypothetical protein U0235_19655 [Polyangiaceae bacterium]
MEQRKAKGAMTFVLKGARNAFRNNENHSSPETLQHAGASREARPVGKDLLFVFGLREDVGDPARRDHQRRSRHGADRLRTGGFVKEDQADSVPESGDARDPRTKRRTPRTPPQDGVAPASGGETEEPKGAGPTP